MNKHEEFISEIQAIEDVICNELSMAVDSIKYIHKLTDQMLDLIRKQETFMNCQERRIQQLEERLNEATH